MSRGCVACCCCCCCCSSPSGSCGTWPSLSTPATLQGFQRCCNLAIVVAFRVGCPSDFQRQSCPGVTAKGSASSPHVEDARACPASSTQRSSRHGLSRCRNAFSRTLHCRCHDELPASEWSKQTTSHVSGPRGRESWPPLATTTRWPSDCTYRDESMCSRLRIAWVWSAVVDVTIREAVRQCPCPLTRLGISFQRRINKPRLLRSSDPLPWPSRHCSWR